MERARSLLPTSLPRDLTAGLVVFFVALPLCLGVALASNAEPFAGLLAGIVGGIIVGVLSKSQTSVSGPAAGLTAVVALQIAKLGSFEAFLLAVTIAGVIQLVLGLIRAGFIAVFFPTSVINGLLAAIGTILILKQIPHVVGHDTDPEGEMAFFQPDHENTFSEFAAMLGDFHIGAAVIGLTSLALLVFWDRSKLKKSLIPAPLIVVLLGVGLQIAFRCLGGRWAIGSSHLVDVPVANELHDFVGFLTLPDFSQWTNPAIYLSAVMIALVASLETLLNLEAVDKLDPQRRTSPPNRELVAQGIGNLVAGLIGGLPITSVVVRSSVNINAGGKTKLSTIAHGGLLLLCVAFFPSWLNQIPLSCLAAILLVTGAKLASPSLARKMWNEGRHQFLPFAATVIAIVLTDLLVGILIGLAISIAFILHSNLRRPLRRVLERHLGGDVLRIELANQVSFLNRAVLMKTFSEIPRGGQVLLDARNTDYIDPDVLDLIHEFKEKTAPAHGVRVSLAGFRNQYRFKDEIQFVDCSSQDLREKLTPEQVLQILRDGNARFRSGNRLTRDLCRQVDATAQGQFPLAVVLSCIDSRTPAELIFDLGLGDIFSVRIAGNVMREKVLGSMEYGCAVAGAKLILVTGHTRCGAANAAVELFFRNETAVHATGCEHLDSIVEEMQRSIDLPGGRPLGEPSAAEKSQIAEEVVRRNVLRVVEAIPQRSQVLHRLMDENRLVVAGCIYDVCTGRVEFLTHPTTVPATSVQSETVR